MKLDDRARQALLALREEPDLDADRLARIARRLSAGAARRPRRAPWQPATVALMILAAAGIAGAAVGIVTLRSAPVAPRNVAKTAASAERKRPAHARRALPAPPVVPLAPAEPANPVTAAPPVIPVTPARPSVPARSTWPPPKRYRTIASRALPARASGPPAAQPDDGAEVQLFSSLVRSLKQERNPRAALDLIGQYQQRFPGGHFAGEVVVMKVEALQSLGRSNDALIVLRQSALEALPRSLELQLVRGELAAEAGQCREALADLERVLAARTPAVLSARALYARAACRLRLGDEAGAQDDLRLYLSRHPDGAQAAAARRLLGP
jgi:hypothetical protein